MVIFFEPFVSSCVGPRRSPAALCVRPRCSLCRSVGPRRSALSLLPGALCVGPRRSLCRGRGALCVALCVGRSLCQAWRSFALCVGICVKPRHSPAALCVGPRRLLHSVSGPTTFLQFVLCPACSSPAFHLVRGRSAGPPSGPHADSACHPSGPAPSSDPRATYFDRWHANAFRSRRPSSDLCCYPSSPVRSLFPGENYCLGDFMSGSGRLSGLGHSFFVSGPALLWRGGRHSWPGASSARSVSGARRSLCRGTALCVGPALLLCVGLLCRGPALLVSERPGTPCVGARRCRGSAMALFVSALCVGARRLVSGPAAPCVGAGSCLWRVGVWVRRRSSPKTLFSGTSGLCVGSGAFCVEAQRSVCRAGALCVVGGDQRSLCPAAALFVVGARRSFYRGLALSVRVCVEPGLFLYTRSSALFSALRRSLCVRTRRFVSACVSSPGGPRWCRRLGRCFGVSMSGPGALYVGARRSGPALFVSGPGASCVGARRSLCRGPVLSVESRRRGPAVLSQDSLCHVGGLCVGPRRFLSDRRARRSFVGAGPGALCVGARRSVCRGPALFVSGFAPALSVRVCLELGLFLYRSSALFSALCVGARRSPALSLFRDPSLARASAVVSESVSCGPAGENPKLFCLGDDGSKGPNYCALLGTRTTVQVLLKKSLVKK